MAKSCAKEEQIPNPVVHWEVRSQQPKKLQDFYQKLFDWHVNANNPMNYGLVDTKAGGINGGINGSEGGNNLVTFYVEVDNPQAYLDKVEKLGGKTVMPATAITNMVTFALFSDPEGNIIGLVKSEQR